MGVDAVERLRQDPAVVGEQRVELGARRLHFSPSTVLMVLISTATSYGLVT